MTLGINSNTFSYQCSSVITFPLSNVHGQQGKGACARASAPPPPHPPSMCVLVCVWESVAFSRVCAMGGGGGVVQFDLAVCACMRGVHLCVSNVCMRMCVYRRVCVGVYLLVIALAS